MEAKFSILVVWIKPHVASRNTKLLAFYQMRQTLWQGKSPNTRIKNTFCFASNVKVDGRSRTNELWLPQGPSNVFTPLVGVCMLYFSCGYLTVFYFYYINSIASMVPCGYYNCHLHLWSSNGRSMSVSVFNYMKEEHRKFPYSPFIC